ncbi:MAG TPA: hypothetical protein VLW75_05035 [Rhizomicrobium sp.]|nr:hypothetical protein [Rhizomicrobium sp.]
MIGLDTNILIRYLTQDDPRLSPKATALMERRPQIFAAMTLLRNGTADFADALIGLLSERAGCVHTFTFDKKASRLRGFKLLS